MARVSYTTTAGELRVYEYPPPERDTALDRCRRSLAWAKALKRVSPKRWQAGPQGRRYQNSTVEQLIARGEAVRDGDLVRAV